MKAWMILLFSLLAENSKASALHDRTNQTESAAGNCLRSHWEVVLFVYDLNMDGKISSEDMEDGKIFIGKKNYIMTASEIEGWYIKWFNSCVRWDQDEIAERDYGAVQKADFLNYNDIYVKKMNRCEYIWKYVTNIDSNDIVSAREYSIALRAIENKDKSYIKDLDPTDKWILVDVLYNYWTYYLKYDNCTDGYDL